MNTLCLVAIERKINVLIFHLWHIISFYGSVATERMVYVGLVVVAFDVLHWDVVDFRVLHLDVLDMMVYVVLSNQLVVAYVDTAKLDFYTQIL